MREFFPVLMLVAAAVFATLYVGTAVEFRNHRGQAIERGYALYCPTTGDFAWKGECDE